MARQQIGIMRTRRRKRGGEGCAKARQAAQADAERRHEQDDAIDTEDAARRKQKQLPDAVRQTILAQL